jgi:threonine/homoserine/homoserine lactone efflux protein
VSFSIPEESKLSALLPDPVLLTAFVGASLVLALTPGPAVLYIVARSLAQGRRSGLASVAAVALGNLANAVAAAIGLAALFAVSSLAFTAVKWAGAAYLVWLGVQALRRPVAASSSSPDTAGGAPARQSLLRVMRDGFLVALLNPKTTLFFAAFLPQFMSPGVSPAVQSVSLGVLFVLIAGTTDCLWVLGASWLAPRVSGLKRVGSAGRYFSAGTYIGLGVFTALSGQRPRV